LASKLTDDLELYSDLLLSVGTHKGTRPLIPIEVSNLISRLKEEENVNDSEVSKMLDLGRPKKITNIDTKRDPTQVNNFLKLQKLSSRSQKLLGWGGTEPDKIPFTTGAIVAELDNPQDQDTIIQSSLDRGITKNEAKRIVQLKKKTPDMPISDCIEKVLKIRPITEIWYIVSHTPVPELFNKLSTKAKDTGVSISDYVKKFLISRIKDGKIESVILKGNTFYISMDENSNNYLENEQKKQNKSFSDYMNSILLEAVQ